MCDSWSSDLKRRRRIVPTHSIPVTTLGQRPGSADWRMRDEKTAMFEPVWRDRDVLSMVRRARGFPCQDDFAPLPAAMSIT